MFESFSRLDLSRRWIVRTLPSTQCINFPTIRWDLPNSIWASHLCNINICVWIKKRKKKWKKKQCYLNYKLSVVIVDCFCITWFFLAVLKVVAQQSETSFFLPAHSVCVFVHRFFCLLLHYIWPLLKALVFLSASFSEVYFGLSFLFFGHYHQMVVLCSLFFNKWPWFIHLKNCAICLY